MNQNMKILIVDDERVVRESLYHWFSREGYETGTAENGEEALQKLAKENFDTLFVDMKMPGMGGFELLQTVKALYPDTAVVIITAYGSIDSAVQAMKIGASDYLLKPFKPDQLSLVMEKISQQIKLTSEYKYLKGQMDKISRFDNIIGDSGPMQKIYSVIEEVAKTDAPHPDPGGDRHRKGTHCQGHPCQKPEKQPALCGPELRGLSRFPPGSGIVRVRQGRFYRGLPQPQGFF